MYGYPHLRSLVMQFHEEAHQEAHQQARRRRLLKRARVVAGREQRCGTWHVGLAWGSVLAVPFLKVLIVAAALAASLILAQGKANAEPMLASWYGPGLEGNLTASGERFNANAYTAASSSLPFGTKIRVCYKRGCVTVHSSPIHRDVVSWLENPLGFETRGDSCVNGGACSQPREGGWRDDNHRT